MKNSFIIAGAIILFAFGLVACGDDDAPAVGSSSAVSSSSAAASSSSVISSSAGTSSSSAISSSAGTISVTFTELAANGASGSVTTTELTLTFSLDPAGLAASDITVTGATRGALSGTGLTRRLAISDITVANGANLTVEIANPAGFTISPSSKTFAVNVAPTSVTFTELAANGASGSVTTTELTLTFSLDPAGLAASDITVTGATRGALLGTGLTRRLAISDITVANGANLTV